MNTYHLTVPCKYCKSSTLMRHTRKCDFCWETERAFRGLTLWQAFIWWWRAN